MEMMLGGEAAATATAALTSTTALPPPVAASEAAAVAEPPLHLLHSSSPRAFLRARRRVRQRVDAGEPRNSYSSIPGYSFRRGGLRRGEARGKPQFGRRADDSH